MKAATRELALAGAAGLALGAVGLYLWQKHKVAAATAVSPATPGLLVPASNITPGVSAVTLSAATAQIAQALPVGTVVIVFLPVGATWVSMDGAGITDALLPQSFLFEGPISHTFVWQDASKVTQTSVLSLTAAPGTSPSVTT